MTNIEIINKFIEFIKENYSQHSHLDIAIKIFELLIYVEENIDFIATQPNSLQRHPSNHLAIHIDQAQPSLIKKTLLDFVTEIAINLSELMDMPDEAPDKTSVIYSYLSNINDSNVGCMEARLRPAMNYLSLYKEQGCQNLDDLFGEYSKENKGIFNISSLLDFFSFRVNHHIPVAVACKQDKKKFLIHSLSWQMIQEYCEEVLYWDNLKQDWLKHEKNLAKPLISINKRQTWFFFSFKDNQEAILYLNYIKSLFSLGYVETNPEEIEQLAKAEVKKNDSEWYCFRLTRGQFEKYDSISSYLGKKRLRTQEILDSYQQPWQLPILKETLLAISSLTLEEQKSYLELEQTAIWANRYFLLRAWLQDVDIKQYNYYMLFSQQQKSLTESLLSFIQILLLELEKCAPDLDQKYGADKKFTGVIIKEMGKALLAFPALAKSIRWDEFGFLETFLNGVTTEEQSFKHPLRTGKHKPYTVTTKGAFKREESTSYPKLHPLLTEEIKNYTSIHQSTTLISPKNTVPIFGHQKDRRDTLVGFLFAVTKELCRLPLCYDGGTISRPYEHNTIQAAQQYFNQKSSSSILFSSTKKLKLDNNHVNEVLNRLRFDINTSCIGIFSDTFEARCIAQYYAERTKAYLKRRDGKLPDGYEVPILFYLPGNKKNWTLYTKSQQEEDRKTAQAIFDDLGKIKEKLDESKPEFLFLLDPPTLPLSEKWGIILTLLAFKYKQGYIANRLFGKTNSKQSFMNYLITHQELDFVAYTGEDKNTLWPLALAYAKKQFDCDILPRPERLNYSQVINTQDEAGNTALHYADISGDFMTSLINEGANPYVKNKLGQNKVSLLINDIKKPHSSAILINIFSQEYEGEELDIKWLDKINNLPDEHAEKNNLIRLLCQKILVSYAKKIENYSVFWRTFYLEDYQKTIKALDNSFSNSVQMNNPDCLKVIKGSKTLSKIATFSNLFQLAEKTNHVELEQSLNIQVNK